MLTLHHLNVSRSLRVLWLLEKLGVEYELVKYERNAIFRAPPELATGGRDAWQRLTDQLPDDIAKFC